MEPREILDIYDAVAEFYDHVTIYRDRRDVDFFVEMARDCGGPVLEVGCGTGRVLIPTARAGIEIVGLDLSAAMLSVCRENLSREPEEVRARATLVGGDMRRFDLGRRFALATMPFRPFQHLVEVDDQIMCLASICRHLADGGRLVLDLFNPDFRRLADDIALSEIEEPSFTMPDGRQVVRRSRTVARDNIDQWQDVELAHHITHPDGRRQIVSQRFRMRHFFRFEVEHLLARTGFEVEQLYADYDRSPVGLIDPKEMVFVARKV
jgi:SAM-dependent methyltransferase